MATVIETTSEFEIVQFAGGSDRGICIQISTPDGKYIQLTRDCAAKLRSSINYWLDNPISWKGV